MSATFVTNIIGHDAGITMLSPRSTANPWLENRWTMDDNEAFLMIYIFFFFFTIIISMNRDLDLHCFDQEIRRGGNIWASGVWVKLIYLDIRKEEEVLGKAIFSGW